eukprot:764527-Hanusia_phi.AAC.3
MQTGGDFLNACVSRMGSWLYCLAEDQVTRIYAMEGEEEGEEDVASEIAIALDMKVAMTSVQNMYVFNIQDGKLEQITK